MYVAYHSVLYVAVTLTVPCIALAMAEVYLKGIPPVPQDGSKGLECYERALQGSSGFQQAIIYQCKY